MHQSATTRAWLPAAVSQVRWHTTETCPGVCPHCVPLQGPGAFIKASGRLERDTTKEQVRALGGNAGDLQQLGLGYSVAVGGPAPAAAGGGSGVPPPPPPPPSQPEAAKPAAPAAAAAGQRPAQPQHKQQQQRPRAAPGSSKEGERRHHSSKSGGVPLILVPNATSAMFTMWNAKQFLEQGQFVPR
jgi:hypothetical protein